MQNYREVLYDLIIIDIVMPKMDGFKLFKELGIKRQQREGDILDCGGDVL